MNIHFPFSIFWVGDDCRISSEEEVLSEGARGVFMLMYELVESAGSGELNKERETSVASTVDTTTTAPESDVSTIEEEPVVIHTSDAVESPRESTPTPKNPVTLTQPSLLDVVEQLDSMHISAPSSIASSSTEDSLVNGVEANKPTRSTSFSSTRSRPQTPIFEMKDPQLSPPPTKRMRTMEKDGMEKDDGVLLCSSI
jgi:hypothetical protein